MQQIIDYLYYFLTTGEHQMFFYLTTSYSIGLPTLVILILAHMKSRWKVLMYMIYFLLLGTIELIFATYLEYQHINFPFGVHSNQYVILFCIESLVIILLPFLVNQIFAVTCRQQINYVFGALFMIGLGLIVVPCFFRVNTNEIFMVIYREGTSLGSLMTFKIYRGLFWGACIYALLVMIRKIKTVKDLQERNFYINTCFILLILASQTVVPVFSSFPENLFISAIGYFFLNVLLLKYIVYRFFVDSDSFQSNFPQTMSIELTDREKEVLVLLKQGLTNKNIGVRLCISELTVKSHIQNIYKKLGVNNRIKLINLLKNHHDCLNNGDSNPRL
jgi:DNA-binding CsgD family transcriptional regulator